ncbi:MAG: hypothetical protein AAF432_10665 [Planctomycetota bacterium]
MRRAWFVMLIVGLMAVLSHGDARADDSITPDARTERRGPAVATITVTDSTVTSGDVIELTLNVTAPDGVQITLPELEWDDAALRLVSTVNRPDVPVEAGRQWSGTYRFDSFAPGDHALPELIIKMMDERGTDESIETEWRLAPMSVTVEGVANRTDVTADLEAMLDEPLIIASQDEAPWSSLSRRLGWLTVLWVVGVIVLVALCGYLWWRRRYGPKPAEPTIAPDAWALQHLDALRASDVVEHADWDTFYMRLTSTLRGYIERRWSIAAPELTTDEFLRSIPNHAAFPAEHVDMLAGLLRRADMVKFAQQDAATDECREALETSYAFVRSTPPPPSRNTPEAAA